MAVFGREGIDASLRAVAAEAGLTAGRIVQLFGSKAKLLEACDEHVFGIIREAKRDGIVRAAGAGTMLRNLAMLDEFVPYVAYAARSVQAGGEHSRAFIDHVVDDAVEYVREAVAAGVVVPSIDEPARVRYMTESGLGHLALRLSLDAPKSAAELRTCVQRHFDETTLPALELYTQGFLTDRRMLDAYLLYVGDPPVVDEAEIA